VAGRIIFQSIALALFASSAMGCMSVREFFHLDDSNNAFGPGKSQTYPNDNTLPDRAGIAGGQSSPSNPVVPSGGTGAPVNALPVGGQNAQPYPLAVPTPVPTAPPGVPSAPGVPPGYPQASGNPAQPAPIPAGNPGQPAPVPQGAPGYVGPVIDPHIRTLPTAMGGRLELAPWEVPADRVVEFSKQMETLNAVNRSLLARIRELEAAGATREQALSEAVRDVERADTEISKTQASLQISREEAALLRTRIQLMEKEDVETLKRVILALEKLLNSPPSRSFP
jgi:hypothetical protein